MTRFYIKSEEMYGPASTVCEVIAETGEKAMDQYLNDNQICEDEYWRYFAVDADKEDEANAWLKDEGYSSWEEYYADAYPSRPVEF